MTSFGGLVIFQHLFARLNLFERVADCCAHLPGGASYSHASVLRCLIVHLILGCRRLREIDFYRHDPLVQQVVRLKVLPSVPTVSRLLQSFDTKSVDGLRAANSQLVLERLAQSGSKTITLDFDGSVQSTRRHAEGTAVGFNKEKKGARSYYPLFCVVAQTGQVLDVLHRSGNVHDSRGSVEFVQQCVELARRCLPGVRLEARLDSAFFSDAMVRKLESLGIEYTISVPFERFVVLKKVIEERVWWKRVPDSQRHSQYFEWRWKPESWQKKSRFIFFRSTVGVQRKELIQLDLFRPVAFDHEYKVIVTNKPVGAKHVARFHEGRGCQEKIYAELKSQAQMGYVPCRRLVANQVYLLCSMLVHNLGRELQMEAQPEARPQTQKRTALWIFEELATLRRNIIQRAGRLTRPQGRLTLCLPAIPTLQAAFARFIPANF